MGKGTKEKVVKIAIALYSLQGCDGSDMSFEDFYDSYHPAEKGCIHGAVVAYNIATDSDHDVDDMREW